MNTELDVEDDIYKGCVPFFAGKINGGVYKSGCRPFDSTSEDAIIKVSVLDSGQIQEGRAHVNVYVRDVDAGKGRLMPNKRRLTEISAFGEELVEHLNDALGTNYAISLKGGVSAMEEKDINQHFVSFTFKIKYVTFN